MSTFNIGDVIAERSFEAREATGTEREVTLRMGKPIPDPKEGGDWCCPYQIIGLGDDKVSAAFGVDPLQALLLALQKAGAELSYYQRVQNIKLTWLDDEDLGLPKL